MPLAVEDVLAIQKLVADYNHAADDGDGAGFAALFTEDGSLDAGNGAIRGREALQEFGTGVPVRRPGIQHFVSNISIDGDGEEATLSLYLHLYATLEGAPLPQLVLTGRYADTLRRVDGTWRFKDRTMIPNT